MSSYGPHRQTLLRIDCPVGGWRLCAHRQHSYRWSYTDYINLSFIHQLKIVQKNSNFQTEKGYI